MPKWPYKWTCPRDAAATGSGEISEKSSTKDKPSSCSIILNATSEENGLIRSCSNESSSRYDGGIKSYKKNFFQIACLNYSHCILKCVILTENEHKITFQHNSHHMYKLETAYLNTKS